MRTRSRGMALCFGIGILLAAAEPTIAQTPDARPGIAVLPFTNGGSIGRNREDLGAWQVGLQQMMITELSVNPELRVVERSRLRELLDELELGTTDRVDPQTAARIGQMVGARYVITGVFMDVNGNLRMDARIVDGETSEILRAREVRGRRDNIYDLLVDLSNRVTTGMRLPPLAANLQAERKARVIPAEAWTLYSKALMLEDDGETEEAIELYRLIGQRFPQMTEAREALRQLAETAE
jgi:TolB-like protein